MSNYTFSTRSITVEDIREAVAIHRLEIGEGFLSSLGDRALQLLFSSAANCKSGYLIVAKEGQQGQVCGYLLGTLSTSIFYREFLIRKSVPAFVYVLPRLLSLERLRKLLETLAYPGRHDTQPFPQAELLDIAVLDQHKGKGLAQLLFQEFCFQLTSKGIRDFKVTTGESLTRAQRFYEKMGAQRRATIEVHRGQKTIVYVYTIPALQIE